MFFKVFKKLYSFYTTKSAINKGIRRKLELLGLEDRITPTTFTVVNTNDSGAGSLRQAIIDANSNPTNDVIDFNFSSGTSPYTITLSSKLPSILSASSSGTLFINGPGANGLGDFSLIITGDIANANRDLKIFSINAGGDLTIRGVKVTGAQNKNDGSGGAFDNFGTLAVNYCTISENIAAGRPGGGIYNGSGGVLTVFSSILSGNTADYGGGIYNANGATATVSNSTISGNTANNTSGGIYNGATLTISNSTISGNTAKYGGGIYNNTLLTVSNSTISGNTAKYGGGFNLNGGQTTVSNSTISGNTAQNTGGYGGIYISKGSLQLINSTVSGNDKGGIYNGGNIDITNTIIANSIGGNDYAGTGSIGTNTNNLVEDGSLPGTSEITGDPLLGPLQNNGGPTFTMALSAGSAAIGAGNATMSNASPVNHLDQRGINRTTSDIGAYSFGIAVTTTADSGTGSLRQAIIDANTTPGNDGISFDLSGSSPFTITLSSALPNIINASTAITGGTAGTVTINGLSASSLKIDANNGNFSIFSIDTGGDLTISGVTVTGSKNTANGGAFNNQGNLIVSNSTISGNTASGGGFTGFGGGIYNKGGTATISNSTISGNTAGFGAGIYNTNGGTVTLTNSTLSGNTALSSTAGITNNGISSILNISNSTISNNTAAYACGGIYNAGTLEVSKSTISGNTSSKGNGGGINNGSSGTVNLTNSTLSGNTAVEDISQNYGRGGAIINALGGSVNIINSTIANNSATRYGGGIYNYGTLNIANTIIANSTSGGDFVGNGGAVNLIAPSTAVNNLVTQSGLSWATQKTSAELDLGPLQNNGGPTSTIALGSNSVAIGAGNPTLSNASPVNGLDQRGVARSSTAPSIGAYEYIANTNPTVTLNTNNLADTATTLTITGTGFDTTAANNTVTLSSGTGTVTSATATQLTVTFNTAPSLGNLTAVVTTNAKSSGSAVQVATLTSDFTYTSSGSGVTITGYTGAGGAVTIPSTIFGQPVIAIGNDAFRNNSSLTSIVIPNSVTSIGQAAFDSCTNLVSITLPQNLTSLGPSVFAFCNSLTSIKIPSGVTTLPAYLFVDCNQLAYVSIPSSVTSINNHAFRNCFALNSLYFYGNAPTIPNNTVFTNVPGTIYYLQGATGWTNPFSPNNISTVAVSTPTVTQNAGGLAINATTLTITGTNFVPTASMNTVTFNNGAVGNVTSATATQLIVNLTNQPNTTGSLTAVVTSFGGTSGSAVQVASIVAAPTVTLNTNSLAPSATTLTIAGTGFDTTAANNTVTLSSGTGTVTTATATQLTVTFNTAPSLGNLTAVVTSFGGTSGSSVQVATILNSANTPTFGVPTSTADGFTVQISNYDNNFTYAATATANGTVAISNTGLVTVTGVSPNTSSTATITTTRTNYVSGSAQVTASSLNAANTPAFGTPTSTADGFTVLITNYDANFNYGATGTVGSVAIGNTGLVVVTGVSPNTSSTATITTTRTNYVSGSAQVTASSLNAANTPTFGTPTPTADGFTVLISNYDANFTYGATATAGSVSINGSGLVTVTGVSPNTSSTATITTTRTNYANGSAQVTETSLLAANTPTFGAPTSTADGFTVQISNYDNNFTYGGTATANGTVAISNTGFVTVTGVAAGTSSTATITTTRTGYANGSAQISATGLNAANTPTFGAPTSTADGFTVLISNYDANFTYGATATAGSVSINGSGLVTVTGVSPNTSSTATITTTRTNYVSGSAQVTASSLNAANTPAFGAPTSTADGFTVQISNYDANFTYGATATAGSVSINGSGLVTVTGVSPNTSSTATITTTRTNYVSGSAQVTASSLNAANTPTFGTPTSTADGFTVLITNYDANFNYGATATVGSVSINGSGLVTVTGVSPNTSSTATITTTRTNYVSGSAQVTATSLAPTPTPVPLVTGSGSMVPGGASTVSLIDPNTGQPNGEAVPFPGFTGQIRVAAGDFNQDGRAEIVAAAGPGGGPAVTIIDSQTGVQRASFFAYDPSFTGGVFVAVKDINNDGIADIVTGAGVGGGPHVKVFNGVNLQEIRSFFAYAETFTGGVSVGTADINGDNILDLVTGAGPGGGPHVKVFDGATNALISSWFAYPVNFTGGVFVGMGDISNDGNVEVVTGAGQGGAPVVAVWNPFTGQLLSQFLAYSQAFTGGVRVGVSDGNSDGVLDLITGAGPGGGPQVNGYNFPNLDLLFSFFSGDPSNNAGVFVS